MIVLDALVNVLCDFRDRKTVHKRTKMMVLTKFSNASRGFQDRRTVQNDNVGRKSRCIARFSGPQHGPKTVQNDGFVRDSRCIARYRELRSPRHSSRLHGTVFCDWCDEVSERQNVITTWCRDVFVTGAGLDAVPCNGTRFPGVQNVTLDLVQRVCFVTEQVWTRCPLMGRD